MISDNNTQHGWDNGRFLVTQNCDNKFTNKPIKIEKIS